MKTLRVAIQKRFADSDILGHVNNVNLQHYFDVGKVDFMTTNLEIDVLHDSKGFITASTTTNYLVQTKYFEDVCVDTMVESIGNKSLTMFQKILSIETGEVKAESRSVFVAFNFDKQESIIIPDNWREALK